MRQKKAKDVILIEDIIPTEQLVYYQDHPVEFIEDIIFHENSIHYKEDGYYLSQQQIQILRAMVTDVSKNVAVVSGKGLGKTALGAFIVLWFITVFPEPKIAITAPSFPQLNSAFWPEVNLWLQRSLLKDVFTHTAERLYYTAAPKNWWAEPRTATKPESMQGLHQTHQLIVIDEGSGVEDDIFQAIDDTQTKEHNITLAISNGTKTNGWFYDAHHKDAEDWDLFQFNAMDSPFVNKERAEKRIRKFGWDSDIVRVGIRGLFPKGNADSFIQLEEYTDAVYRTYIPKQTDRISIGIDVARLGPDLTSFCWKWGNKVYKPITMGKARSNEVEDFAVANIKQVRMQTGVKEKIRVKIDDTGIGGTLVDYLRLKSDELNIEVIGCTFSSGNGDDTYHDIVSIMWGAAKKLLPILDMPEDEFLQEEATTRRVGYATGRIKIESKDSYKSEFGDSPDRADSWILCCYEPKDERRVLSSFNAYDNGIVVPHVDYKGNHSVFTSVWYSNDLYTSSVKVVWDEYRLYVVDEYEGEDSVVRAVSFIKSTFNDEIIGNKVMFGTRGQDIKSQFSKFDCYITQNRMFDLYGGTQLLNQMIQDGRFRIQQSCRNTIRQLDHWDMTGAKKMQEVDFGLCHALVNVVSRLRNMILPEPTPVFERDPEYNFRGAPELTGNPAEYW